MHASHRLKHTIGLLSALVATTAGAVPFDITITNTGTNGTYGWSAGLLTLSPLIAVGPSPQPGAPQYATYAYANSHCNVSDGFCGTGCSDNGNAAVLAARWGLTPGVDTWLVPALPAGQGASATVTIDAPPGSRLSFIAWVANTGVFDDFVALHEFGDTSALSVPLFDAGGAPLPSVTFAIDGYDVNSTSPTNGGGTTCSPECPTPASGCYVAPGNASVSTYPPQPPAPTVVALAATGPATTSVAQVTYTFDWSNTSGTSAGNAVLRYTLPAGVQYVSSTNGGTLSGSTVTWNLGTINNGGAGSRSVTVALQAAGTTWHSATLTYNRGSTGGPLTNVVSNVVSTRYTPALTAQWTYTDPTGHMTDGLAVANLTNNGGSEVLVVAPTMGSSGPGRAFVLRSDTGAQVNEFVTAAGRNLTGFPLAEQLSGGGTLEYVVGEPLPVASSGAVYSRNGSSTARWASAPWGYPSYWNMGPAAGNALPGVNGTEVLVADWDGNVAVLQGSNGAVQSSLNVWNLLGDHPFGHAALTDVDGDGTLEAVLWGYPKGMVTVLNADVAGTLTVQWTSASLRTLYGDFAYGSGPAVGDIDGDGRPEIVVATWGTNGDVYAFDATQPSGSACEHRFDTGATAYSSPVIGDVDGSGRKSIVVMSSSGVLSVLKASATGCASAGGSVVWQHTVKAGDRSSFTPVLYDVDGDGVLDVITASNTRVVGLNVRTRQVLFTFDDPTAVFAPSGAVANADTGSAVRELYVTGWRNSKVYRLNLPATATSSNEWPTFMGGNSRAGSR